ncbi:MAG: hypothetical protein ACT4O2_05655, partial [Beijerinckiaceae bacterium]
MAEVVQHDGSVRCGVERANTTMKRWYGMTRVRYLGLDLGLARNNRHLQFVEAGARAYEDGVSRAPGEL